MHKDIEIKLDAREAFVPFLNREQRFAVLACHRRSGKSVHCTMDMMQALFTIKRPGPPVRLGFVAPTFPQAKTIIWGYIRDFFSLIPGMEFNEQQLKATYGPSGAHVQLFSAESGERMRGLYFDGIYLDEFQDHPAGLLDAVIRPALSDYQGFIVAAGTPKGRANPLYRLIELAEKNGDEWFSLRLKASESGIIDPKELETIRKSIDANIFNQEFEVDFLAASAGTIYAHHVERARAEGRISNDILQRAEYPVHISFDIGAPVNTIATVFQIIGDRVVVLEDIQGSHELVTPGDWASLFRRRNYDIASIILPHDAGADVGGQWQPGFIDAGFHQLTIVPRCISIWDKVQALAELFPRLTFRQAHCEYLLESLINYHSKIEQDGLTVRETPTHDWSSHACSALETAAQAIEQGLIINHQIVSTAPTRALRPQDFRKTRARR